MVNCAACGRWAGPVNEPCPHCGASPRRKAASAAAPRTEPLAFSDEARPRDDVARAMEDTQRTPTPAEFERWYSVLDESPVFAQTTPPSRRAAPAGPVVAPLDTPRPVVQPIQAAAPVVEPVTPNADARRLDIESVFEVPSAPAADEPVVGLLVTLTPDGPPLLDPKVEPVAHVILALDLSASMNHPDKYPLLTEALAGMLYDLRRPGTPDVLVSVVLFAYGSEVVFRDRLATSLDARDVIREIDRSTLRFGRYTDVAGALKQAGKIAIDQVRANKAMPVRICLLTDGRPQDMTGAKHVMERIRTMPVDVDALAFGSDADVAALQEVVSGGRGGTVKQIRSDTIHEAFGRIAETASKVISNRAVFELELRPGVVGGAAYRHRPGRHAFGAQAFADGRTFRTDLGALEAGRPYSLYFQLRLPVTEAPETEVGRVAVRIPGYGGARLFEALLSISRHSGELQVTTDREVQAAHDVLVALDTKDPREQVRALRVRKKLYESERRDPQLIGAIERAIDELESHGHLGRLSAEEQAVILSHTCTAGSAR
jgi:uncharacterized protein YegL